MYPNVAQLLEVGIVFHHLCINHPFFLQLPNHYYYLYCYCYFRDTFVVCTVNTFTSFYSAIVIFSILGFMANAKGVEIADVVKSGKAKT